MAEQQRPQPEPPRALGFGLGLRNVHFEHILKHWPEVDWFEAISENFMDSGGRPGHVLRLIAERYPVVLHGVSMSIGSTATLDRAYLTKLKVLADAVKARWVSDHLCWTGIAGVNSHDLLPLPLNEESLRHVAARVIQVQDILGRRLILENPSTYAEFQQSDMAEPDFLRYLCDETDCGLLLDVNNVYVSSFNAGSDPVAYLEAFPFERVVQMHVAGHQHCGSHIIDTHDGPVHRAVWELFRFAWARTGGASTLLEWDGNIPPFVDCHAELLKAKQYTSGEFDPGSLEWEAQDGHAFTSNPPAQSTSNPVNFLVPQVMASTEMDAT